MTEIITVTDVQPLEALRIQVVLSDGAVKQIDLSELIGRGVFSSRSASIVRSSSRSGSTPTAAPSSGPGKWTLIPRFSTGSSSPPRVCGSGVGPSAGRTRRSFRSPPEADLAGSSGEAQPKILLLGKIPRGGAACSSAHRCGLPSAAGVAYAQSRRRPTSTRPLARCGCAVTSGREPELRLWQARRHSS
jgi:hypothetical protein